MNYFLCGNTGITNRGCDAIIRSTIKVLNKNPSDIFLTTYGFQKDLHLCYELGITPVQYFQTSNKITKIFGKLDSLFRKGNILYNRVSQSYLTSMIGNDDICFVIGGDTYCYGLTASYPNAAINRFAKEKGAKTVLWCCSLEKKYFNKFLLKDFKRYDYILAREELTYQSLISFGLSKEKVLKACDPAFFLDAKPIIEIEKYVKPDAQTIGINLSECVINDNNSHVFSAFVSFIQNILKNTQYSICLIPHVYSIKDNQCDWPILTRIKEIFSDDDRVSIVDKEYTSQELKFIISKCSFMICARTHASIAAYSSLVPTIVIGYSVKSKGISMDLFGTTEKYVIPYESIYDDTVLFNSFNFLVENQDKIKKHLSTVLVDYKKQLTEALSIIFKKDTHPLISLSNSFLCTGCLACKSVCPRDAINIIADKKGFKYPSIDNDKCIKCQTCMAVCPVLRTGCEYNDYSNAFFAQSNSIDLLKKSTSGGVFGEVAFAFLSNGGVVYGAAFNKDFKLVHARIDSADQLFVLFGSKYIQSDNLNSYHMVENDLKNGLKVLYCGTPCQIAALQSIISDKNKKNLYTIDFLCHGLPSTFVWEKYFDYIEHKNSSKISKYYFRDKGLGWENSGTTHVVLNNKKEIVENNSKNLYFFSFVSNLSNRESCFHCKYRIFKSGSDLTIGDGWYYSKEMLKKEYGISFVRVNDQKATEMLQMVKNICVDQDEEGIKKEKAEISKLIFPHQLSYKMKYNKRTIRQIKKYMLITKNRYLSYLCNGLSWVSKNEK